MARSRKRSATPNTLRIIGGQWRGRKLTFSPVEGLRPTADRVRETLFNWLAPVIRDARCLDLFAGSGALGLEALSRGAASCDFVDTSVTALRHIAQHLRTLDADRRALCHAGPALAFLQGASAPYEIVFIDPPFGKNLVEPVCAQLARPGLLSAGGFIYVETSVRDPVPAVPADWLLQREKVASEVAYRLYIRDA